MLSYKIGQLATTDSVFRAVVMSRKTVKEIFSMKRYRIVASKVTVMVKAIISTREKMNSKTLGRGLGKDKKITGWCNVWRKWSLLMLDKRRRAAELKEVVVEGWMDRKCTTCQSVCREEYKIWSDANGEIRLLGNEGTWGRQLKMTCSLLENSNGAINHLQKSGSSELETPKLSWNERDCRNFKRGHVNAGMICCSYNLESVRNHRQIYYDPIKGS